MTPKRTFRTRDFAPDADADVREEIEAHLAMKADELRSQGMSEEQARAEAARCFGEPEEVRAAATQHARSFHRRRWISGNLAILVQDLRYGARVLRRSPGFTAVTVLLLGLGIGATTAIFSVFRAVFLDPLPLPEADRLVFLWERTPEVPLFPASFANYNDWREQNRSFDEMGAYLARAVNLTDRGDPVQLRGALVTSSIFPTLGVTPALGRTITQEEDESGARVAVLGHEIWSTRYGSDPDLVGQTIELNGEPYLVVGIMPSGFLLPDAWAREPVAVWTPLPFGTHFEPRGSHSFQVLGRLSGSTSLETARADMDRVAAQLREAYPEDNEGAGIRIEPVHDVLFGEAGSQVLVVLAAAALVLLIACGNVASLYLARSLGRRAEMAVRQSLGAGRGRIVRQLLSESALLALAGAGMGLVLCVWTMGGIQRLIPGTFPRTGNIRVDASVLGFALAAAAFTALLFGPVPALVSSRADLTGPLKTGGRGAGSGAGGRSRAQATFLVGQLALGLILANAALLLLQSYGRLGRTELGFRTDNVLTMSLTLRGRGYSRFPERAAFYAELFPRLKALPGVTRVGASTSLPLQGGGNLRVITEGQWPDLPAHQGPLVDFDQVSGDYFEALGVPLLSGRFLLEGVDDVHASQGVLVNRAAARLLWPDEDPLGQRLSLSDSPPSWMTVVGVVGDSRQWGLELEPNPELYLPYSLLPTGQMFLTLATRGEPLALIGGVRREIAAVDPAQAVSRIRTMEEIVGEQLSRREFYTVLIASFSLLALILAAVGSYGVISYFVAGRRHEIGIRIALGAANAGVVHLVARRTFLLTVAGVLLGFLGVLGSGRLLRGLLYGVAPLDPGALLGGGACLLAVSTLAAVLPALRATRVPPATAFRGE